MKLTVPMSHTKIQKGFTLIELIVVIAILGVLSVVLITTIDPIDKINAANDTGVISSLAQFGKANDQYAATHDNTYVQGTTVTESLSATTGLNYAGESKLTSYTAPTGYTVNYATTASCTTAAKTCVNYAYWVTALKSKKYGGPASGQMYVYANGKGCLVANGTSITATYSCP